MKETIKPAFWQTAILALIGVFCGAMMMTFMQTQFSSEKLIGKENLIISLWLGFCILGATILFELRKRVHKIIQCLALTDDARKLFLKYHIITYVIFLGYGFVLAGIKANLAFAILLLILFIITQIGLLWLSADRPQKERWLNSLDAVPALFFVSGFAALIYQVVWQRVLFSTFGTNIESVTVIVSVFMFGLGIGALAGGQLQKYFPTRLLECFVGIEIAIGVFGVFSIPLIHKIGELVPHNSLPALIVTTYALLAFPTMLMGSTLPLLVGYLQKRYITLGAIVGKLYAYNTLGSACASLLTVMLLFTMMGQQSTLIIAAACNAVTAYMVWFVCKKTSVPNNSGTLAETITDEIKIFPNTVSYRMALLLSAMVGYISLSLEILWFRIIGFMTANMPQVFGMLLAVFLGGIAYGSLKAKQWSESGKDAHDFIARSLLWMAVLAYVAVPLTGVISAWIGKPLGELAGYIAVGLLAYCSGGIFPLLCQIGINLPRGKQTGVAVSWIYFLNIIGATLGSLITGFILLDIFTLAQNVIIIWAGVIFLLVLFLRKPSTSYIAVGVASVVLALGLQPMLYGNIVGELQGFSPAIATLKYVYENRHGIITVTEDKRGDIIFGNGAYDGRFNIDPVINSNIITRAYMLAALHPDPQRILEIGLSSGSWARVFTLYQPLHELVSVEINPGYLNMIAHYPDISILHHPKWTHHIDDGRRWLTNNPNERFDAIVMNTTYYWRNNATNLLSREFLELCKRHLNPGGIIYYNTTDARDSIYTAAHVFKYVTTYVNFVAASDAPFDLTYAQKKKNLLAFVDDNGKSVFANPDPKYQALLETLAKEPLKDVRDSILNEKNLWLITDDNMASEYKIDHSFLPPFLR